MGPRLNGDRKEKQQLLPTSYLVPTTKVSKDLGLKVIMVGERKDGGEMGEEGEWVLGKGVGVRVYSIGRRNTTYLGR
jgi:hypothetical protein